MPDITLWRIGQFSLSGRPGWTRTLDHSQTARRVSCLDRTCLERDRAHQEDTKTDEDRHGVNEWLAHEPASSVSGCHVALDSSTMGSETIKRLCVLYWIVCLESAGVRLRTGVIVAEEAEGTWPAATTWTEAAMPGSVHSLDTSDSLSDASLDLDEDALLAQQEWEESIEQLQKLLSLVLLPMAGKYFGRTFSYWSESRSTCGVGKGLLIMLSTL